MAKERRERVKEGGGSGILAFLLGLLLGIIAILGAFAGVGVYLYKQPIDKTIQLIDKDGTLYEKLFNAETGYLNEKYANETIGTLLTDGLKAISALSKGGSLESLNDITPKTGATVDKVLKTTDKYGIPIEKDTLMSKPVGEIASYVEGQVKETPLGSLMEGVNGAPLTDNIMLTICYGPSTHYTTDENGNVIMNQIIYTCEDVTTSEGSVKTLFDVDGDSMSAEGTLNYDAAVKNFRFNDSEEVHYLKLDTEATEKETYLAFTDEALTIPALHSKTKVKDFTSDASNLFNDLTLADTLGVTKYSTSHPVLVALAYGTKDENYIVNEDDTITMLPGSTPNTIGDLKKENQDLIDSITLADALQVTASSHNVLISMAYGKKGVDYQINEKADGTKEIEVLNRDAIRTLKDLSDNSENLINDVPLTDVLPVDKDSKLTMYLLYGRENVHYALDADDNVVMLQKRIAVLGNKVYNEYGEIIENFDIENSDLANGVYVDAKGMTYYFTPSDVSLGTIKTKLANGKSDGTEDMAQLHYLFQDGDDAKVPALYEAATLGSISSDNNPITTMTTRLTVSEVFDNDTISGNMFLKHVPNETIETLPDAILDLKLTQVYEKDVYKYDATTEKFLDKNNQPLDEDDVENRVVNPEWWYLLHDANDCKPGEEGHETCGTDNSNCITHYSVNTLGALVNNMKNNVQTATLFRLDDDGMIDLDGESLKKEVKFTGLSSTLTESLTAAGIHSGVQLGTLTVTQAIRYLTAILSIL